MQNNKYNYDKKKLKISCIFVIVKTELKSKRSSIKFFLNHFS